MEPISSTRPVGAAQAARERFTGLDGLRGLAVIAVLTFHQGFPWARGGYLGVSLFFTLSGFLIARLLIAEVEQTGGLRLGAFWGRRLRRLAPAALLTLLLVCVFGAVFATESQRSSLRGDVWSSIANVTNWRFISSSSSYGDLFKDPSPVQHFWSLAIEEQFYLVFPLVVAGAAFVALKLSRSALGVRRLLATVVVVLMLASLAAQLLFGSVDRLYYGTDTRAFELLAGVLLACVWRPGAARRGVAWALATIGAALFAVTLGLWATAGFGGSWLFDGGLAGVAIVSVVVIAAATVPGPVRMIGSWRPLVAVGLVSYGIYLFHWPVYLALDPERTGMQGWRLFAVRLCATGALAVASYSLLEMPIRRGGIRRAKVAPVVWAAAIAAVALAVPFVIPAADRTRVVDEAAFQRAQAFVDAQPTRHSTTIDSPDAPLRAYVVGDSTGVMFAGGLARYGTRTGRVEVRTSAIHGCPLGKADQFKLWQYTEQLQSNRLDPECPTIADKWSEDLAQWRPDMIVVVSGPTSSTAVHPIGAPDDTWVLPTEPAGRTLITEGATRTARALQQAAPHVPQLWLTSPYTHRIDWQNGTKTDPQGPQVPAYTDVYNAIITDLAHTEPDVTILPWADRFNQRPVDQDAYERPDGVHVLPERIDTILDTWFPILVKARDGMLTTSTSAGTAPIGPARGSGQSGSAPLSVYVVGDSTGVMFAGGLARFGTRTGLAEVRSGAALGCPIARSDQYKLWQSAPELQNGGGDMECRTIAVTWSEDLAREKPDMIVVVSGPTSTAAFHPIGAPEGTWVLPTDPRGRAALADGAADVAQALRIAAPDVPQLWLTAPYIYRIGMENGTKTDPQGPQVPAYTDVYNAIVADLARTQPNVATVPWADQFNREPIANDAEQRPDGVHMLPERIDQVLDTWFPILVKARAGVLARSSSSVSSAARS